MRKECIYTLFETLSERTSRFNLTPGDPRFIRGGEDDEY